MAVLVSFTGPEPLVLPLWPGCNRIGRRPPTSDYAELEGGRWLEQRQWLLTIRGGQAWLCDDHSTNQSVVLAPGACSPAPTDERRPAQARPPLAPHPGASLDPHQQASLEHLDWHGTVVASLEPGTTVSSAYAGFVFGWLGAGARPSRWLHLRHPDGFTDAHFAMFRAHCRIWWAYAEAVLADWAVLEPGAPAAPRYLRFPPERAGTTVSLPIGGDSTLASRATLEDAASHLLSDFFPLEFRLQLEEGLTETTAAAQGPTTRWRPVLRCAAT